LTSRSVCPDWPEDIAGDGHEPNFVTLMILTRAALGWEDNAAENSNRRHKLP
jgi:hypothetical protein